jgi:hypothetical protein
MSAFSAVLVAKVVVPVALVVGGTAAFVAARQNVAPSGESRAWIDSPLDGATVMVGPLDLVAHASGPGDVARIELVVDGAVAGDFDQLTQTDRLSTGSQRWTATVGSHALVARARVGSTTVESAAVDIVVTDDKSLLVAPGRGQKPVPVATAPTTQPRPPTTGLATTTTVAPPTEASTTTEVPTTTTEVPTTEVPTTEPTEPTDPTTTVPETALSTSPPITVTPTTIPAGEPPRINGVTLAPNAPISITTNTDVSILARAVSPSGHAITITISMKGATGDWVVVKTCAASPCVHTSRFSVAVWQYRATVTDDLGRSATSSDARFVVSAP